MERTLVDEVKEFLSSLRSEFPGLFDAARPQGPSTAGRSSGRTVPYLGREVEVRVSERPGASCSELVQDSDALHILRGDDRAAPQAVLRDWLVSRARDAIEGRAAHWAPRMEVTYESVSVRDQRTLWGSCTKEGRLHFNWRLVMAPPGVLEYIVIHELAHRHEMNHSRRFWAHVERHCPEWKAHRRWLKDNAFKLGRAVRRETRRSD